MKKVEGVDSVRVTWETGLTVLDLKPGNRVTLATLREVIRNSGFVPKDATVVARGAVSTTTGQDMFTIDGTQEQVPLASKPVSIGRDWRFTVPSR